MKNIARKIGTAALCLLMLFAVCLGAASLGKVSAGAEEAEMTVSRILNVVYDDSGSMHNNGSHSWYQAKYSMEIFSAMMQEKDHMNIYYMSTYTGITDEEEAKAVDPLISIDGREANKQQNVNTIHNEVTYTGLTPYSSIVGGYANLKEETGYTEKWLIVITDGDAFDNDEDSEDLDALFSDCGENGIRVVYLAIGQRAIVPTPTRDVAVYQAESSSADGESQILSRVTEICQSIFQRPSYETIVNGELELTLPVSEIIVFAQGESVNVDPIEGATASRVSASITEDDIDKATLNPNATNIQIREMYGEIVTFLPQSGSYFLEGNYKIGIDAEEYIIYYRPCLEFAVDFRDEDGNEYDGSPIVPGTYYVDCYLTYPEGHDKYGEKVDTSGLDVTYSKVMIDENGTEHEITSDRIQLGEGSYTLSFSADYLQYVSVDRTFSVVVEALEYIFTLPDSLQFDLTRMEADGRFDITLTNQGEPLTDEEWAAVDITVDAPDGIAFEVIKGANGNATLQLRYPGGILQNTSVGDIDYTVNASADGSLIASADGSLHIVDDRLAATLALVFDDQDSSYSNKNFGNENPIRPFTVTINGQPLTKEQYDALTFTVEGDGDVLPEVVLNEYREGGPTTGYVQFAPGTENLAALAGEHAFTVSAQGDYFGQPLSASTEDRIAVDDTRTAWEIFLDLLPIIITVLVILFLILAYSPLIKHYLPWKIEYSYGDDLEWEMTVFPYKSFRTILTLLIPFKAVSGVVFCSFDDSISDDTYSFTLLFKAAKGKRMAECTNLHDLNEEYQINYMDDNASIDFDSTVINSKVGRGVDCLRFGKNQGFFSEEQY